MHKSPTPVQHAKHRYISLISSAFTHCHVPSQVAAAKCEGRPFEVAHYGTFPGYENTPVAVVGLSPAQNLRQETRCADPTWAVEPTIQLGLDPLVCFICSPPICTRRMSLWLTLHLGRHLSMLRLILDPPPTTTQIFSKIDGIPRIKLIDPA